MLVSFNRVTFNPPAGFSSIKINLTLLDKKGFVLGTLVKCFLLLLFFHKLAFCHFDFFGVCMWVRYDRSGGTCECVCVCVCIVASLFVTIGQNLFALFECPVSVMCTCTSSILLLLVAALLLFCSFSAASITGHCVA